MNFDINLIKKILKERGISREELAKMSNVPLSTINKVLGGHTPTPRLDTTSAILKALDLETEQETPTDLLSGLAKRGLTIEKFNELPEEHKKILIDVIATYLDKIED